MLALVFGAVRARAAQAVTVLILTALAAAVAVAGPWYAVSAAERAAASDVEHAPIEQRGISVRQQTAVGADPREALDAFAADVARVLPVAGVEPVLSLSTGQLVLRDDGDGSETTIAYRDGLCEQVQLTGDCPARAGEVVLSETAAQELNAPPGTTLQIAPAQYSDPRPVRVVGTYRQANPAGAYWSNVPFGDEAELDPFYTVLDTFTAGSFREPLAAYDIQLPTAALRGGGGDSGDGLAALLRRAERDASTRNGMRLIHTAGPLLETIAADRRLVRDGTLVALAQVLLLSWFAMGLAGRWTGRDRRADAALLKLRGSRRRRMLGLAFGQHFLPLLGGTLLGVPLGLAAAWLLGGPVAAHDRGTVVVGAVAGAAAVLLGGLIVLTAVEVATLRLPVAQLLRRVPTGRRSWRADVLDLVLLATAAAAIFQVRTGEPGRGLALLAPGLVALALGLLLARLLTRLADGVGAAALRGGRLRLGLTTVRVSRQPGTDRVFTLVTVAVALFATTAGLWWAGLGARADRAEVELGAARVLTVEAANRTALLQAVRTADPGGRAAMAVAADLNAVPPLVAVDSSRLAAVAQWRPEYGDVTTLPRAVAATTPETPAITGATLTVTARNYRDDPVKLLTTVQHLTTGTVTTTAPAWLPPRREHTAAFEVPGCAAAPGCRLIRWELAGDEEPSRAAPDVRVTVLGVAQRGPERTVLDKAALGDVGRWRSAFRGTGLTVTARPDGLTLASGTPVQKEVPTARAYSVDTALPVPVVLAGEAPQDWQFSDPAVYSLGAAAVPVQVAGRASALPLAGSSGVLTDLGVAARMAADGGDSPATFQVWLSGDAPAGLVPALERGGLTVTGDDTMTGRAARLGEQGFAEGARFALFAAAVGLLLAAAAVAVAMAADRGPHLEQLRALRVQGLPRRAAVTVGYAAGVLLVGAGVLAGLAAALIAGPLARVAPPAFTDGWIVVPPPGPLGALALAGAGLVCLVVLAVTGGLSLVPLHRALRGGKR